MAGHAVQRGSLLDYWKTYRAMLQVAIALVLVVLSVVLDYFFISLQKPLGDALQSLNETLFYQSMYRLVMFALAFAVNTLCLESLIMWCKICWREQVTRPLLDVLFKHGVFIRLQQYKKQATQDLKASIDSNTVAQRVQEDISNAMKTLSYLVDNLFRVGKLMIYSVLLFEISPALTLIGFVVPHYLLWFAWLSALLAVGFSWWAGSPLVKKINEVRSYDSAFRAEMMDAEAHSDSVDNTAGVRAWYAWRVHDVFNRVIQGLRNIFSVTVTFKTVQVLIARLFWIIPYLLVAPAVFHGSMTLGSLLLVQTAFQKVFYNIHEAFDRLPRYSDTYVSWRRVEALQGGMVDAHQAAQSDVAQQQRPHTAKADIRVQLTVGKEQNGLLKEVHIPSEQLFAPAGLGRVCRIDGANGSGKSQSLKGISNYRIAKLLALPKGYTLFPIAQSPWRPKGFATMRVDYYLSINAKGCVDKDYDADFVKNALGQLYFLKEQTPAISAKDYRRILNMKMSEASGGQMQKLALIRALLHANDKTILLADEPFAALDENSVAAARALLDQRLAQGQMACAVLVDHQHGASDNTVMVATVESPMAPSA